jgi:hypothetical protein
MAGAFVYIPDPFAHQLTIVLAPRTRPRPTATGLGPGFAAPAPIPSFQQASITTSLAPQPRPARKTRSFLARPVVLFAGNRVSQLAQETLYSGTGFNRVSQVAQETLMSGVPSGNDRVSQVAVEVLLKASLARPIQTCLVRTRPRHTIHFVTVARVAAATLTVPFIASHTTVYALTLTGTEQVTVPFIPSHTVLYPIQLNQVVLPFIPAHNTFYSIQLNQIDLPFIPSRTRVYDIFNVFNPTITGTGPGNGGETTLIRLNAFNYVTTATLNGSISASSGTLHMTGDLGMPVGHNFVVMIDSEVLYLSPSGGGTYSVLGRGVSNTTAASHTNGVTIYWGDSYDMAITSTENIDAQFTADILDTGSILYPGWLISYDSSQAYLGASRYPMHVTKVVGVYAAGTGITGSSKLDASQPNAICTPVGVSDNCAAALSNPARIQTDIVTGDVAVVRYQNPENTVLDLGPRSAALQSWFGIKRVDLTDNDVTFTNANGIAVDTTGGYGTFTGSVNGEFHNPSSIGIAPATGGPTPLPVPYTTVTLPGATRYFTYGPPGFNEAGWPIACLSVRQGNRRIPFWESYDWHNYGYVYDGYGTDCSYAQMLINRNGVVFDSLPEYELPGPQDMTGPDAVWDDGTYYFGVSWYVVIFNGFYLVVGPPIGGGVPPMIGGPVSYTPIVSFPGGGVPPPITIPTLPPVEGGSGGGINPPAGDLHVWRWT